MNTPLGPKRKLNDLVNALCPYCRSLGQALVTWHGDTDALICATCLREFPVIEAAGQLICRRCHTVSDGMAPDAESYLAEMAPYVLGYFYKPVLVVAVAHSIWLWATRRGPFWPSRTVCPACRSNDILPVTTPCGRDLFWRRHKQLLNS